MTKARTLWIVGAGLGLTLAAASAQATTLQPLAPAQGGILHHAHDIYIEPGYHRHRHHHGHVHGNPHGPHLDCVWHGHHEHCQLHIPRRRERHWGHVHGDPRRPHLDCRWHGDHEHCRVHIPRRYRDRYYYHY
jgi:hypothetical protein